MTKKELEAENARLKKYIENFTVEVTERLDYYEEKKRFFGAELLCLFPVRNIAPYGIDDKPLSISDESERNINRELHSIHPLVHPFEVVRAI